MKTGDCNYCGNIITLKHMILLKSTTYVLGQAYDDVCCFIKDETMRTLSSLTGHPKFI